MRPGALNGGKRRVLQRLSGDRVSAFARASVLAIALGAVFAIEPALPSAASTQFTLTVSKTGSGAGKVTSSPSGIDCGSTCSHNYNAGTKVTLTAHPDSHSTFEGWSGCGSKSGVTCVVSVINQHEVFARFMGHYKLTVLRAGNGHGTVTSSPSGINCRATCSHFYDGGTLVTLIPTADSNSRFY